MAEGKKFYWLKLKRDFFKRHDIRIIEEMPNGKDYVLFYLKLLLESIDHEGSLRFSDTIPYNEQMLAVVTNTNIDIVRSAMKLFTELNLMEVLDDATIYMAEVTNMIGSETKWAEYKRKGIKAKANELPKLTVCERLSNEQIRLPSGDIHYVDEKRYGGNAGLALDRAEGKCELCGSTENIVIHHNNGYSNALEDLVVCCKKCHAKLENFQSDSKTFPIEKEEESDKDKELYIENERKNESSFAQPTHIKNDSFSTEFSTGEDKIRKALGGELGQGLVLLSQEQMDDLLNKLSLEEFDHYVRVVADCIKKGKRFTRKTHYQAILDMAAQDRAIK